MNSNSILRPIALLMLATPAFAQSYSYVFAFGDSLTDNGNLYGATGWPPPPYWEGRFSDGPLWVEQLANHVGLSANSISDHAVGGATTGDIFNQQVLPYLTASGGSVPGDALYIVWGGANDLLNGGDPGTLIATAMQNTAQSVVALISSGARTIMVPNLPDLSSTPLILATHDPVLIANVEALTMAYNAYLAQTIAQIEFYYPGVNLIDFDTFGLTRSIVTDPRALGFKEAEFPALDEGGVVAQHPNQFVFWDDIHPTTRTHSFLMGAALGRLGILWGDIDGNGVLSGGDLAGLAQQFGPCNPGTPADMDGNGTVDGLDLELLVLVLH